MALGSLTNKFIQLLTSDRFQWRQIVT